MYNFFGATLEQHGLKWNESMHYTVKLLHIMCGISQFNSIRLDGGEVKWEVSLGVRVRHQVHYGARPGLLPFFWLKPNLDFMTVPDTKL